MRASRPEGFGFFTLCALACAYFMAVLLAGNGLHHDYLLLQRLAVGITGALALVAAEAIWFERRWAFRASLALGAMFLPMEFLVAGDLTIGFGLSIPALLLIVSALLTVRRGIAARHASRTPIRTPRP